MTATATIQRDGWTRLTFPYDPTLIERLKRNIPAHERRWVPEEKSWFVTRPYSTLGITLVRRTYPEIEVVTEPLTWTRDNDDWGSWDDEPSAPPPPPLRKNDPLYAALHLLPSAPPELVTAAYRCLARLNHPDVGGNTATMQTINAAHSTLKARGAA